MDVKSCSGILGQKYEIGRLKLKGGHCVAATLALRRREINEAITSAVKGFQPPAVQEIRAEERADGDLQALFSGETIKRTLGDLLWTSAGNYPQAEAAVKEIFLANLTASQQTIRGLNGLAEIFNPFTVNWRRGEGSSFDFTGDQYVPFLVQDTTGTGTILEAGGLTRLETGVGLESMPMQAGYSVKNGLIVADWRNAVRVKFLLEWATKLPLAFLPHYRDCSLIDTRYTAEPQMEAVVDACMLRNRVLSFFWRGISGGNYSEWPQVTVFDPTEGRSGSLLRNPGVQETAAIFLTLAKEKIA